MFYQYKTIVFGGSSQAHFTSAVSKFSPPTEKILLLDTSDQLGHRLELTDSGAVATNATAGIFGTAGTGPGKSGASGTGTGKSGASGTGNRLSPPGSDAPTVLISR